MDGNYTTDWTLWTSDMPNVRVSKLMAERRLKPRFHPEIRSNNVATI